LPCGHKGCSLPEVSVTLFLSLQFFALLRLLESNFLTHVKMYVKLRLTQHKPTLFKYINTLQNNVLIRFLTSSTYYETYGFINRKTVCACSFLWYVFHAFQ